MCLVYIFPNIQSIQFLNSSDVHMRYTDRNPDRYKETERRTNRDKEIQREREREREREIARY